MALDARDRIGAMMKWSSTVSTEADLDTALDETVARVRAELGGAPDLAVAFVSPHHQARYADLPRRLGRTLGARVMVGCSAGGVIGGGHEVEGNPGLSLTAAALPEVELTPFHVADLDELMRHESWGRKGRRPSGGAVVTPPPPEKPRLPSRGPPATRGAAGAP